MSAFKLKKFVSPYRCDSSIGIRVRIECTSSTGLSSKIFAYLPSGKFNHVCNVVDMKECPENTPSEGKWPKWYRLNYVDLLLPHVDMAEDFIDKVEEDVEDLYNNMITYNKLIQEGVYIVGNPEDL